MVALRALTCRFVPNIFCFCLFVRFFFSETLRNYFAKCSANWVNTQKRDCWKHDARLEAVMCRIRAKKQLARSRINISWDSVLSFLETEFYPNKVFQFVCWAAKMPVEDYSSWSILIFLLKHRATMLSYFNCNNEFWMTPLGLTGKRNEEFFLRFHAFLFFTLFTVWQKTTPSS